LAEETAGPGAQSIAATGKTKQTISLFNNSMSSCVS
jgi:hypothetical protein